MENMAKGCGRSDAVDGVERRPRIVIPSVESKVDSLTSTTYTSTSYSSTQTFAVGVRRFPFLHACVKCLLTNFINPHTNLSFRYLIFSPDRLLHHLWIHGRSRQYECLRLEMPTMLNTLKNRN